MEIFAYCGQLEHAMTTFNVLVYKTVEHYRTLIDAFGKYDDINGAEGVYTKMMNDPSITYPTLDVYAALMSGYSNLTKHPPKVIVDSMVDVIRRLEKEEKCLQHGILADRDLYHELLKSLPAACDVHRCEAAIAILDKLKENLETFGPHSDEDAINARVVIPNRKTYLAALSVCLQARDFDGAVSIVHRMARTPIPAPIPKKRF
jgi:pentatricopeptide repeat protein